MGYNQNSLNLGAAGSEKNLWGLRQQEEKKKKKRAMPAQWIGARLTWRLHQP